MSELVTFAKRVLRPEVVVAVAAAVILAACGGSSDSTSSDATATSTAAPTAASTVAPTTATGQATVGIIAIGHSGLTAANTDATIPGQDAPKNSWATGTEPEVNSVYQRLVALHPEIEGHVANAAEGGTGVSALAEQAGLALRQVPLPALVIIQTIDNDIRCDGTDNARLAGFGTKLGDVLRQIAEASPNSTILVVSQLGRPATYAAAIEANPAARATQTGTGMCDMFDETGNVVDERVATLTQIVESYEAEQTRVCATFPQCHGDNGVLSTFADAIDYLSSDWNHLNIKGQAKVAELIWPTIADLLKLQ